jgi:SAM-dependent methyltransferase
MTPQCNLCGHQGKFLNPEQGREGWHCANCSSSSRNRMVTFALGRMLGYGGAPVYLWPQNQALKILEPCPRGPQAMFLRDKFDYCAPEFDLEKIKAGAKPQDYADLQNLAFAGETFDVVITSDVFEHVREDLKGYKEIYRTLKKGGIFLLTVPYDHQREKTIVRVAVEGDKDVFLMEPRYHGGGGSTLAYREYGRDLLDLLRAVGFAVGYVETAVPGFQIQKSGLIVCQKSPYLDLEKLWPLEAEKNFKAVGTLLPYRLFVFLKYNLKSFLQFGREIKHKISG